MTTLSIGAGNGYNVYIGRGLIAQCGALFRRDMGLCRLALVTDSNVEKLWLEITQRALRDAGYAVYPFVFPAGERSKNLSTLSDMLEFFTQSGLTRQDCAVALGGGVVGDLTGFAAGCYMRGIRFAQIPTTFLAAVDASIGGKTAVNLAAGKNLAGLFHQPCAVVADSACFDSLPGDVFADGAAEAIKTGVLSDETLFAILEKGDLKRDIDEIVRRCIAYKARIVEADVFDQGLRRALNLGHTPAHAIEKLSGYAISHGHAVAMGLSTMARAAAKKGLCPARDTLRIVQTLSRVGLPTSSPFSASEMAQAALSDKKRAGEKITIVVPRAVGQCDLLDIDVRDLCQWFEAGSEDRA